MKINFTWQLLLTFLVFTVLTISCGESEDKTDEESTEAQDTTQTPPASQPQDGQRHLASDTTENLATVETNMLPGSLAIGNSSSLRLTDDDDNPCSDADGFFDCQPALLRLYLSLARQMVGVTVNIVDEIAGSLFTHVSIPTDGVEVCETLEIDDSDDVNEVQYCVTSETEFSILMKTTAGPFIYLDVDEADYEIWANMANEPGGDGNDMGVIHASIDYTSATEFDVDVQLVGMGCEDEDLRAPDAINIIVSRTDDVWQGKAMMYHPRWLFDDDDDVTCDTDPSEEMSMVLMTDFVGNDTNSSAALYIAPVSVDSTSDIGDYPASDFCSNFTDACYSGYGFGDPNPVSSYENDFCVTDDEATWGAACDDDDELISTPTYLSADQFMTPEALSTLDSSDMPEDL